MADTQPYGSVSYADPDYQKDKVKRYPIDTAAHVKAAWSYINMPKNASQYSGENLAAIKGRIKAAAKKFGIEISDSGRTMEEQMSIPNFLAAALIRPRSEEHTSELQSRLHLVCR